MPADEVYDRLNDLLAGDLYCDREATEEECNEAIALGAEQEEREQLKVAIEQEQIIEASRSVRAGTDMLFAALRKNGVL